jgi:hypothetical protein
MILEVILLLFSITVLLLVVYLYRRKLVPEPDEAPPPPPPPDTTKKCKFLFSDIDDGHTFTVYEDAVKDTSVQVDCDKCDQYVYKTFDGCTRYVNTDIGYSMDSSTSGLCTNIGFSTQCDKVFLKKTPQTK